MKSDASAESMWAIVALVCALGGDLGARALEGESNILRLSKGPRALPPATTGRTAVNATDLFGGRKRKVLASKNNPELDWQKYLLLAAAAAAAGGEDAREVDLDFAITKAQKTGNSVQWLTDLYDPLNWVKVPGEPSGECKRDLERFLGALRNGQTWAAKSKR